MRLGNRLWVWDDEPLGPPLRARVKRWERVKAWEYDGEMCKRRKEIERLFGHLKGFRRIFSRFDKLDVIFLFIHPSFILFALIVAAL